AYARDEGDDLASEAWIDVARGLHRFSGDEVDFKKWLFTIARRRLIDHRRRSARRPAHPVSHERLVEIPGTDDVEGLALDTLTVQEAIVRLVEVLSAEQAEVLILRAVAGLSAEEAGSG